MRLELRLRQPSAHRSCITNQAYALVRGAEDAGFEPARACTQHAFQACALGH